MNFVLDASVTLAWCFEDEASDATLNILKRLDEETAFVPTIWPLEIGNILLVAERKKRISYADITKFLTLIERSHIQVDHETTHRSLHEVISLAHAEKLTSYDASYLELAMRRGIPLYTKDRQLRKVAIQLGVESPFIN